MWPVRGVGHAGTGLSRPCMAIVIGKDYILPVARLMISMVVESEANTELRPWGS